MEKEAGIPVSYSVVFPDVEWLLHASKLGFSPPAVGSGLHCRLLSVLQLAEMKHHI